MNGPIPPPPKPQYLEQQGLFYGAVRALHVPYDISPALEADLRATDRRCSNNVPDSDPDSCSSLEFSRLFSKRSGSDDEMSVKTVVSFPLPSREQLASIILRTLGLPRTMGAFAVDLIFASVICGIAIVQAHRQRSSLFSFTRGQRSYAIFYRVDIGILLIALIRSASLVGSWWRLHSAVAKDVFLEACVRAKASPSSHPRHHPCQAR